MEQNMDQNRADEFALDRFAGLLERLFQKYGPEVLKEIAEREDSQRSGAERSEIPEK